MKLSLSLFLELVKSCRNDYKRFFSLIMRLIMHQVLNNRFFFEIQLRLLLENHNGDL